MSTSAATPATPAPSLWRARWRTQYLPPLLVFILVVVLWELFILVLQPSILLLPAPHQIGQTLWDNRATLALYGFNTWREAMAGFVLGCSVGIIMALFVARWQLLADVIVPLAVASNAVPIVALAPLAIVWFGIGEGSKIAIVTLMCFFPTLISGVQGLKAATGPELDLMRSYAASEWQTFRKVRLPTALPYLFNAFKICATLSMIGAIVAEFFGGSTKFLGVYIKTEASILHTREAWAAIVVACLIGIAFYLAVAVTERLVMPWHVTQRGDS